MKVKPKPCKVCKDWTDHYESGGCGTPYCGEWGESHCWTCGWFTTSCQCGSCNYQDTVSERTRQTIARRKMARKA